MIVSVFIAGIDQGDVGGPSLGRLGFVLHDSHARGYMYRTPSVEPT